MIHDEQRIARLERLITDLSTRVAVLEGGEAPAPVPARTAPTPPAVEPADPWPVPSRPPQVTIPQFELRLGRDDLEDLLGGRVLAWVGGLAVLLGVVFLFALAVSSGWIGETARVLLAGAGSTGLLALGVWLHERKARTDAALAAVAAGIAGLFVTVTVAAQVYELIPHLSAAVCAVGVGALATALALRWESRGIAALGILGALMAPVLVGAGGEGGTMVILFVALASAAGVVLWQRWDWLSFAATLVAIPQWAIYVLGGASLVEQLAVLVAFGCLGAAVAIGHELRTGEKRLRVSPAYLLALNGVAVSAIGWAALSAGGDDVIHGWMQTVDTGNAWLTAVSLVHIGIGLIGFRIPRMSLGLRLLALVIGIALADVAFALMVDGPALAIGWALTGVGFATLVRRVTRPPGDVSADLFVQFGLGAHLGLALLNALALSRPDEVLAGAETLSLGGAAAVLALAAGCLVSSQIVGEHNRPWKLLLDSVGLLAVAVYTALALDGLQLVLAWTLEVVALAAIARRSGDENAAWGAAGFLGLVAMHALAIEAPPVSLVTGLADPVAAVVALGAVTGCLVLLAGWCDDARVATWLRGGAAVAALYLASTGVVTPFESDAAVDSALLSAHQQGQMVLSVFWALVGVGTIVVGLRGDLAIVRLAGLTLLAVTIGKAFMFDLSTLTAGYRVVSFICLGLLLLGGAFVWQRLRPRQLSDLRETPQGVR